MAAYVPVIVALIGGFFSAPVWSYLTRLLGWSQSEIERLRSDVNDGKALHTKCEQQVRELMERIAVIEHHHASHFARWLSDAKHRIVWLNSKALVSIFGPMGLTREDIEGKTFGDLLDKSAAAELDRLAQAALVHDGSAVSNLIRLHPDLPVMHIVKIAGAGRDGELIYDAIAFRPNDPGIVLGLGVARTREARAKSFDNLSGQSPDDKLPG